MMPNRVARALRTPPPDVAVMRQGVVTQASPLLVRVGSSTTGTPCRRLTSYTPTLNDEVTVLVQGADRVVLGLAV